MATNAHPILIAGQWRAAEPTGTFTATNPRTREPLPDVYPVSGWPDLDAALAAASRAAVELRAMPDAAERCAAFLDAYAVAIEANADAIVAAAAAETGLALSPRLRDVELPRTTGQLRQAAAAARDGAWQRPTIDTKNNLRSCLAPLGVVWAIGPNNFPFAYNGVAGGDFAAAIAGGNPVIAKGHPLHPTTTRLLAEAAHAAATAAGLPAGTVQLVYHLSPDDGRKLIEDRRLAAVGFTGSRAGGLALKAAADAAGKPFFGEMSSLNPVVILPGAMTDAVADQLVASVTLGTGQFCTKPGLAFVLAGDGTDAFVEQVRAKLAAAPAGVLFSAGGQAGLLTSIDTVKRAGAVVRAGGTANATGGFGVVNTLMIADGGAFVRHPEAFQTEAFGNATLVVVVDDVTQLRAALASLDGNLTGSVYSAADGSDDAAYVVASAELRPRVGRLLNDKMPTGVAVSPAQQHGGPYPATSQPHFTAVGLPAAILRFTQLQAYDNVRADRLPPCLRDRNPTGRLWRMVDGNWTQADV